ncbi:MFS transporter [Niallia oryzisoli]|uniref:MFS transporter n=1 Tax=Niallia oryzisoli TaxID=1737571 RepID=A0ABZ2CR64_9BACI
MGSAFGSLFGGRLSDNKGHRKAILYLAILFFFSAVGCVIAPNTTIMVFSVFYWDLLLVVHRSLFHLILPKCHLQNGVVGWLHKMN